VIWGNWNNKNTVLLAMATDVIVPLSRISRLVYNRPPMMSARMLTPCRTNSIWDSTVSTGQRMSRRSSQQSRHSSLRSSRHSNQVSNRLGHRLNSRRSNLLSSPLSNRLGRPLSSQLINRHNNRHNNQLSNLLVCLLNVIILLPVPVLKCLLNRSFCGHGPR